MKKLSLLLVFIANIGFAQINIKGLRTATTTTTTDTAIIKQGSVIKKVGLSTVLFTNLKFVQYTQTGNYTLPDLSTAEKAINGFTRVFDITGNAAFTLTAPASWTNANGNNLDPAFINTISAWVVYGNVLYSVTKRSAPDVTPPTFTTNSIPTIGSNTANYTTQINKIGFVKWGVSTSVTTPSKAAILAGTGMVAFSSASAPANTLTSISITGLTASTAYYLYSYAIDVSGNETTIQTAISFTTTAVVVNKAINFNGVTQVATTSVAPTVLNFGNGSITQPFSVSYWAKWDGTNGTGAAVSVSDPNPLFYFGSSWGSGAPYINVFSAGSSSNQKFCGLTSPIAANTWVHLCWTWDGTNILMYVNGTLQVAGALTQGVSGTFTAMASQGANARLFVNGQAGGSPSPVKIRMDDVCIWTKRLIQSEVTEAFSSTNLSTHSAQSFIGALYKFNDTFNDSGSNGYNLSGVTTPAYVTDAPY